MKSRYGKERESINLSILGRYVPRYNQTVCPGFARHVCKIRCRINDIVHGRDIIINDIRALS